ncbi:hypothetical protein GJR93_30870 [Aminobacter sp. MDW-2]|nr:hypothetical protein [Aminobacter sp. MDW-2]
MQTSRPACSLHRPSWRTSGSPSRKRGLRWGLASLVVLMIKLMPGDEAQMAAGAVASWPPHRCPILQSATPVALRAASKPQTDIY